MGWCSGTLVFDPQVKAILKMNSLSKKEKIKLILNLAYALEDRDWDCQQDSDYWDNPLVRQAFKKLHPDWDWEEMETREE